MVQFAKKMGKCLKFRHGTGKKERDRAYRTHYRGCKRRQPEKGQSPHKNQEVVFSLDFSLLFSYTIIYLEKHGGISMVHFILACNKIKKMFVENTISIYASNVVFFIMLSFFPFAMFFLLVFFVMLLSQSAQRRKPENR